MTGYYISAQAKEPQACWQWITFLSQEPGAVQGLPARRSLAESDVPDPFTDPVTLARAVTMGVLDAPHLKNNPFARGQIVTRIDARGACVVVDSATSLSRNALPTSTSVAHCARLNCVFWNLEIGRPNALRSWV